MKCLIFDLDGTLVDSEGLCNQAFLNLLPELDDNVESLVERYRGKRLAAILSDLERRLNKSLPSGFEVNYRTEVSRLFEDMLKPTDGAAEALYKLDNPKCVASSGPRPKIEQSLALTGLRKFFEGNIFSSYEVKSWKPDPDLFLFAATQMKHDASNCIVIEDSDVGIEAATVAGMASIRYSPNGATNHPNTLRSMHDLPNLINSL